MEIVLGEWKCEELVKGVDDNPGGGSEENFRYRAWAQANSQLGPRQWYLRRLSFQRSQGCCRPTGNGEGYRDIIGAEGFEVWVGIQLTVLGAVQFRNCFTNLQEDGGKGDASYTPGTGVFPNVKS